MVCTFTWDQFYQRGSLEAVSLAMSMMRTPLDQVVSTLDADYSSGVSFDSLGEGSVSGPEASLVYSRVRKLRNVQRKEPTKCLGRNDKLKTIDEIVRVNGHIEHQHLSDQMKES